MKTILLLLACLTIPLTSCQTTGGSSEVAIAVVRGGVTYAASKHLSSSKSQIVWDERHAQLQALSDALESAVKDGVSYATLRPLLAARFADKPEVMLLADIVLPYIKPVGVGALDNAYLAAGSDALKAALKLPPPVFAVATP